MRSILEIDIGASVLDFCRRLHQTIGEGDQIMLGLILPFQLLGDMQISCN